MKPNLLTALGELERLLGSVGGDFIIIGAVAANFLGAEFETKDIDICGSRGDIEKLKSGAIYRDATGYKIEKIRSNPFFRISSSQGFDFEFMGDIEIFRANQWQSLDFGRVIKCNGFNIPDFKSQLHILEQFGRDKDLNKIILMHELAECGKIRTDL